MTPFDKKSIKNRDWDLTIYGGGIVDCINATWPLVRLSCDKDGLLFRFFFKSYYFKKEEIIRLEQNTSSFTKGIQIHHTRDSYSSFILFRTFGDVGIIVEEINSILKTKPKTKL